MTFSLLFIILLAFFLAKSIFLTVSFLPYFLLHFSFSLYFFLSSSLFYFILPSLFTFSCLLLFMFVLLSSFLDFIFVHDLSLFLFFFLFLHSTSFFYNFLLHLLPIILSDQDSFFPHKMTDLNTLAPSPKQISHIF